MLSEICAEIKNYFTYESDKHIGDWVISEGAISPSIEIPTDYIRIIGSRLNDGVHKASEMALVDEEFHGAIWIMSPPSNFLYLVEDIKTWQSANGSVGSIAMSPFASESFGEYSYSKNIETPTTWQEIFAKRLNAYRKVREL